MSRLDIVLLALILIMPALISLIGLIIAVKLNLVAGIITVALGFVLAIVPLVGTLVDRLE